MSKELNFKNLLPTVVHSSNLAEIDASLNKTFVGIDFGTSTTVVSIATKGDLKKPVIVENLEISQKLEDGSVFKSYKVPTVVAYYNNSILVGEGARKNKYKLRLWKNLWHSFKMELGEDVGCKYPESELGRDSGIYTILNPVDVTTLFFKFLKAKIDEIIIEKNLPRKTEFSVSIPASFEANQRRDLLTSLENNGILVNKQSLIDEPNAAFLSYILNSDEDNIVIKIPENYFPNILVFDFGAGTCDISVLELGQDNNGVYSKNIAISKFEKLGGDDIDKLIAIDILLPQIMFSSNKKISDFRTRELYELIIPKLLPIAERLKVMICEKAVLMSTTQSISEISRSQDFITLGNTVNINTSVGDLTLKEPKINFKGFADVMAVFTLENSNNSVKRIEKEYEFINIFQPISTALKKANLTVDKIDYVLFIGGSAKNPFIQNALKKYFENSQILIPADLQAQVSRGAAIHSFLYNGFGKNVIQPITSEPILLISKKNDREVVEPIIEAGTLIPSDIKSIDNLSAQREGQEVIEMPICVGSKNKILYNIMLHADGLNGFSLSDRIRLEFEINSDKMLMIRATAGNKKILVEPINPFSNKELTSQDRIKLKAEKEYNLSCAENGGKPTLQSLQNLHKVYDSLELELKAAESLELINEYFPGKSNLNNIGVHYSKAGKKDKALQFYEKAMIESPSHYTALNLALHFENKDLTKFNDYLNTAYNLDSEDNITCYLKGKHLRNQGNVNEAEKFLQGAFDRWKLKFDQNRMNSWDYSWFSSCARALGKTDFAKIIESAVPNKTFDLIYNVENLTQLQQEKGLIK